jgi:hypothetical protein
VIHTDTFNVIFQSDSYWARLNRSQLYFTLEPVVSAVPTGSSSAPGGDTAMPAPPYFVKKGSIERHRRTASAFLEN